MKHNQTAATKKMLVHEGGYTNHPSDPGGPTNFGITIHDFRKHIDPQGTAADVKRMTLNQAIKIYDVNYWDKQKCDDLYDGLDYAIFDYGVNSGIGRTGRVMRRLLKLQDRGNRPIDQEILDALPTDQKKQRALIIRLMDERLAFLKALRTWPTFGAGWGRRVSEVRRDALKMFDEAQRKIAESAKSTDEDGEEVDAPPAKPPVLTAGEKTATAAGGAGSGTIAISDITDAAERAVEAKGHAETLGITDVLAKLVTYPTFWIGVAAMVAIAGYIGYRWYKRSREF